MKLKIPKSSTKQSEKKFFFFFLVTLLDKSVSRYIWPSAHTFITHIHGSHTQINLGKRNKGRTRWGKERKRKLQGEI